jgi:hypothetical protein
MLNNPLIMLLIMVMVRSGSVELITLELQFENPFSDSDNLSTLKVTINSGGLCTLVTHLQRKV